MEQAIRDGGLEPGEVSHERTGIIMGSGGPSTRTIVESADVTRSRGPKRVGPFAVPKAMSSTASATLATWFKIKGVNYSISSACATSNHCIGNAYELIQMGKHGIERARWNWDEVERNPFFCPDAEQAKFFEAYLDDIRKRGSSVGAVIEVVAEGVPVGLGAPIYGKLDGDLAAALMGINAVKGVEIGAGFAAAALSGEENADEIRIGNDGKPVFLSNHAGGILGGISTGQPIVCRFAVKPTSSILTPRRTVDRYGAETEISTKGRHDPCVGIRAVPIGEAMVACVVADHYLRQRGQMGETPAWPFARA